MTDDIHTRIARVLYTRAMSRLSWHRAWDDLQPDVQQMWLDDADAVIRELANVGIIHLSKVVGMEKPPLFGQHLAVGDDGPIMVNSPKEPERTWGCGKANCKACY